MTPRPTATRADAVAQSRTLEQQLSACETTASEARREPLPRVGLDRAEDDHRAPERSLVAKIVRQRAYPCAAEAGSPHRRLPPQRLGNRRRVGAGLLGGVGGTCQCANHVT